MIIGHSDEPRRVAGLVLCMRPGRDYGTVIAKLEHSDFMGILSDQSAVVVHDSSVEKLTSYVCLLALGFPAAKPFGDPVQTLSHDLLLTTNAARYLACFLLDHTQ